MKTYKTKYTDLGLIEYKKAWDMQENIFKSSLALKSFKKGIKEEDKAYAPNHLFFCEHPHVYTLGKSGNEENLLINTLQLQSKEASFFKTNRGGDITYHGPGQIVGYPIIDLENFSLSIRTYIESIEEVIIRLLANFDIKASRLKGATGVWLDPEIPGKARKICAIGVKASRYITMHGFAFNINTDLSYFSFINPCGFTDKAVTSLEKECGHKQDIEALKQMLLKEFSNVFGMDIIA